MDKEHDDEQIEMYYAMPRTEEGFTRMVMERIAKNVIEQAEYGETDPAKVWIKLDFIIKALTLAKTNLTPTALEELIKYEKDQKLLGVSISVKETVKYDYSHNDEWKRLNDEQKVIESDMKAAYKSNKKLLDDETGEIVTPAKIKSASTSITPKYSKE